MINFIWIEWKWGRFAVWNTGKIAQLLLLLFLFLLCNIKHAHELRFAEHIPTKKDKETKNK